MKKMIVKNLVVVISIVMIMSLMLNYIIQYKTCQENMVRDSKALFGQVGRSLQHNELSYVFSLMLANEGVNLYAADLHTGEVLGATNS